jgi:hypothetical protein
VDHKARWEVMVDEATVDCYNEDEAFAGILASLEDRLEFPFQARVLGDAIGVAYIGRMVRRLGWN